MLYSRDVADSDNDVYVWWWWWRWRWRGRRRICPMRAASTVVITAAKPERLPLSFFVGKSFPPTSFQNISSSISNAKNNSKAREWIARLALQRLLGGLWCCILESIERVKAKRVTVSSLFLMVKISSIICALYFNFKL
jgi:hypothetical protein